MSRKRDHINLTSKLAAALLCIPQRDKVGRPVLDGMGHLVPLVSFDEARQMTAHQIVSLFQWDHSVLHALGGSDHPAYLTPRFIREHRAKSKKDASIMARVRRSQVEQAVEVVNSLQAINAKLDKLPKHAPDRRKSRPMPHGRRSATKQTFSRGVVAR
jgi:hypothetical protein